jgi:hypothetical protein
VMVVVCSEGLASAVTGSNRRRSVSVWLQVGGGPSPYPVCPGPLNRAVFPVRQADLGHRGSVGGIAWGRSSAVVLKGQSPIVDIGV